MKRVLAVLLCVITVFTCCTISVNAQATAVVSSNGEASGVTFYSVPNFKYCGQEKDNYCFCACIQMILKRQGGSVPSQGAIAFWSGTTFNGTNMTRALLYLNPKLPKNMRYQSYKCKSKDDMLMCIVADLLVEKPTIFLLRFSESDGFPGHTIGKNSHAVLLYGISEDAKYVRLADPALGFSGSSRTYYTVTTDALYKALVASNLGLAY